MNLQRRISSTWSTASLSFTELYFIAKSSTPQLWFTVTNLFLATAGSLPPNGKQTQSVASERSGEFIVKETNISLRNWLSPKTELKESDDWTAQLQMLLCNC